MVAPHQNWFEGELFPPWAASTLPATLQWGSAHLPPQEVRSNLVFCFFVYKLGRESDHRERQRGGGVSDGGGLGGHPQPNLQAETGGAPPSQDRQVGRNARACLEIGFWILYNSLLI